MNDQALFAVLFALAVVACVGVAIAAQEFWRAGTAQAAASNTPSSLEIEHVELHREPGAARDMPAPDSFGR